MRDGHVHDQVAHIRFYFVQYMHSCRNLSCPLYFSILFRRRSFFRSSAGLLFSSIVFLRLRRSFSLRSSFPFSARDLKIKSQLVTVKISFYVPFLNASVLALPELHHGEVRTLRSSRQPPQSNGHPFQKVSGEF